MIRTAGHKTNKQKTTLTVNFKATGTEIESKTEVSIKKKISFIPIGSRVLMRFDTALRSFTQTNGENEEEVTCGKERVTVNPPSPRKGKSAEAVWLLRSATKVRAMESQVWSFNRTSN